MIKLDPLRFLLMTRDIVKRYGKNGKTVWIKPKYFGKDSKTRYHAALYLRILERCGFVKKVSEKKYLLTREFQNNLMGCNYPDCENCQATICVLKIFGKKTVQKNRKNSDKLKYEKLRDIRLSQLDNMTWRYVTHIILTAKPIDNEV